MFIVVGFITETVVNRIITHMVNLFHECKAIEVLKHLSEISNGKRELNIRQIKLLSERHTNILLWENGFR